MTHAELVRERKMSERRRKKREAAEGKHTPTTATVGAVGRKIPKWDDFVPPDDLNTSQRRVR